MLISVHPETPEKHKIKNIIETLEIGGVIIIPTDSVYALACKMDNKQAVERICKLKHLKPKEAKFSIICPDLSNISEFTNHMSRAAFKLLKKNLPGAFTFILETNNKMPKIFDNKKRQIGIRVPDNNICRILTEELGTPIAVTSLNAPDDTIEYHTDPWEIHHLLGNQVDLVVDGGYGELTPSTVINCLNDDFEIIREGKGELQY